MTSRERVKRFLQGKKTDRIPNGLGACETAGLHACAYHKLKANLEIEDRQNRMYTFMSNSLFEPNVLDAINGDMIITGSSLCPSKMWGPDAAAQWKEYDFWGFPVQVPASSNFRRDSDGSWWWNERSKCPPGGYYFDVPPEKLTGRQKTENNNPLPADFRPSHEIEPERLLPLEQSAKWLYQNTDFSLVCGETIQDLQHKPGGIEAWWMRMISEPGACHEFLDKAVDAALDQLRQLDSAVGEYCETLMIADDMGDGRGVTIGPDLWRKIYKPHYYSLFHGWHEITDMKVLMHNCGAIAEILEDIIECGVDIINPVQISAEGMNPKLLKDRYGDRIVFHGGVYDAVLLASAKSEQTVYDSVKENIEILSQGGGYIFAGVHNLPADMPSSHLRAMLQAYNDCANNATLVGGK